MLKKDVLFIITGTTRGLGKDIFESLMEADENILTINRSQFNYPENIVFDFSEIDKIEGILIPQLKLRIENYRTIVMILNAALIDPIKEIGNYAGSDVIRMINTNFISPVLLSNFLVQEKKEGVIVNLSSGGINFNFEGLGLYTSSKIATHKFFNIANIEDTKINFINFDPGSMDTQMTEKLRDEENHFQEKSRKYLWQKLEDKTYKPSKESADELLALISKNINTN